MMRCTKLLLLLLAWFVMAEAFSLGAFAADPPANLKRMTWKIDGTTREALVYFPPDSVKNPPLIFAFHGHGGTMQFAARRFAFHELWPDAICVYPQGLDTPSRLVDPEGKKTGWQHNVGDQNDRDLKFFDAMLKSMKADRHVDESRIYCSGHSNGGYFTYILWAARNDVFAAVAPIAAILDVKDMKGMKPKPVLHVAGEKDPLVKFAWQERTIEALRKLNNCEGEPKDAGKMCKEYPSKTKTPVVAFIHPGGHEMPAGAPARIVEFFKDQHLP
jgi:polyhydroxybutyrate depolymerase